MSVTTIRWLAELDDDTLAQAHRVITAVVELGGAVGWLAPPPPAETRRWLTDFHRHVQLDRAGLALVEVDGRVEALGGWRANAAGPQAHVAELVKVMVHPDARGLGLGRVLVQALIDAARESGAETAVLGVRGNNHGAQALYESLGFTVWGVLPDGIAVGTQRFDDVRMHRQLHRPDGVERRGTRAGGVGGSVDRRGAARRGDAPGGASQDRSARTP